VTASIQERDRSGIRATTKSVSAARSSHIVASPCSVGIETCGRPQVLSMPPAARGGWPIERTSSVSAVGEGGPAAWSSSAKAASRR
jgi:hypothetical protein